MRLIPGRLIYGVDPRILRSGMRSLNHGFGTGEARFDHHDFARHLGAPVGEATSVLEQMCADGCFTQQAARRGGVEYVPQPGFYRMISAPISHGITRMEADRLLALVVAKAHEINADSGKYWHRVKRLAVFGSYLKGGETLGDLDIGFELEETSDATPGYAATRDIFAFMGQVSRRRRAAEIALRLRRPNKVSLHLYSELESLNINHRRLI